MKKAIIGALIFVVLVYALMIFISLNNSPTHQCVKGECGNECNCSK